MDKKVYSEAALTARFPHLKAWLADLDEASVEQHWITGRLRSWALRRLQTYLSRNLLLRCFEALRYILLSAFFPWFQWSEFLFLRVGQILFAGFLFGALEDLRTGTQNGPPDSGDLHRARALTWLCSGVLFLLLFGSSPLSPNVFGSVRILLVVQCVLGFFRTLDSAIQARRGIPPQAFDHTFLQEAAVTILILASAFWSRFLQASPAWTLLACLLVQFFTTEFLNWRWSLSRPGRRSWRLFRSQDFRSLFEADLLGTFTRGLGGGFLFSLPLFIYLQFDLDQAHPRRLFTYLLLMPVLGLLSRSALIFSRRFRRDVSPVSSWVGRALAGELLLWFAGTGLFLALLIAILFPDLGPGVLVATASAGPLSVLGAYLFFQNRPLGGCWLILSFYHLAGVEARLPVAVVAGVTVATLARRLWRYKVLDTRLGVRFLPGVRGPEILRKVEKKFRVQIDQRHFREHVVSVSSKDLKSVWEELVVESLGRVVIGADVGRKPRYRFPRSLFSRVPRIVVPLCEADRALKILKRAVQKNQKSAALRTSDTTVTLEFPDHRTVIVRGSGASEG